MGICSSHEIISFLKSNCQHYTTLWMERNKEIAKKVEIYCHCGRCNKQATPSCMEHRQQIEVLRGTEINSLLIRKRYECTFCFKVGFASVENDQERIECDFCKSTNVRFV